MPATHLWVRLHPSPDMPAREDQGARSLMPYETSGISVLRRAGGRWGQSRSLRGVGGNPPRQSPLRSVGCPPAHPRSPQQGRRGRRAEAPSPQLRTPCPNRAGENDARTPVPRLRRCRVPGVGSAELASPQEVTSEGESGEPPERRSGEDIRAEGPVKTLVSTSPVRSTVVP